MPACYAYNCTNGSHKPSCKGIRYFRIPSSQREQERRRLWIAALRRKGEPYTAARVCSDHFVSGELFVSRVAFDRVLPKAFE